ncbi:MAG: DNA replication and repair protein RecF [Candidatus Kapabacteria bacterium]|nr:DNA replication and repair protein RecF [Candidatus Kapabacteria bacterium]
MIIRSVTLDNVRNHAHTVVPCTSGVNILTGPNGAGKTSVLEAISMCAMARSFVPVPESSLLRKGASACAMRLQAKRDSDVPYHVTISFGEGSRKRIDTALGDGVTARDLIGELAVVALSPDHKSITLGGPADRRSFLDGLLAQASHRYRDLLYDHRRILKQRNALLADAEGQVSRVAGILESWTEQFVDVSAQLVVRRSEAIMQLAPVVAESYAGVSANAERVDVRYEPDVLGPITDADYGAVVSAMAAAARKLCDAEVRRGQTLFGPQKDDVGFFIDGRPVRETASQGQHKSLLVALKLAECHRLVDGTGERPVVLLDDVFAELDKARCAHVMRLVLAMNMQCFVTTTEGPTIACMVPEGVDIAMFDVDNGTIADPISR